MNTMFLAMIVSALVGAASLSWALAPLWRGVAPEKADAGSSSEVEMLKQAIASLGADLERGVIAPDEYKRLHRELARRLLAADNASDLDGESRSRSVSVPKFAILAAGAALLFATAGLYGWLGAADRPALPHAERDFEQERSVRLTQREAETAFFFVAPPSEPDADTKALLGRLEAELVGRPDEKEGRALLARSQLNLGRPDRAWPAMLELAAMETPEAAEALYPEIARTMVLAADGYISSDAVAVFERAGEQPIARYFLGIAALQSNDRAGALEALKRWAALLEDYPAASTAPLVHAQVMELRVSLGLAPEAIALRFGTSVTALVSAELLAERAALEAAPEDLPRWARLIRKLRYLGRQDAAREAGRRAVVLLERAPESMQQLGDALSIPVFPPPEPLR